MKFSSDFNHDAVMRTAYGIVRHHDVAEDVTQQAFVEVYGSISRYDLQRPFAPWLQRIAVNLSLDELRRTRSDQRLQEAEQVASEAPSVEQAAEDSEARQAIWEALRGLSAKHRAAVVMRYYHGMSEPEMATALNCRRGTVKSRLYTALRKLRPILDEQVEFPSTRARTDPLSPGVSGGRVAHPLGR